MNGTDREDMLSMQEEAKQRVLDMRARSRFAAEQMNRRLQPESRDGAPPGHSAALTREETERLFLLSLCLLLSHEDADESVLLALMYLMS